MATPSTQGNQHQMRQDKTLDTKKTLVPLQSHRDNRVLVEKLIQGHPQHENHQGVYTDKPKGEK